MDKVESLLLMNKFDHENFEPRQMDERARSSYIHMLSMHTPVNKRNQAAPALDKYPDYKHLNS